MTPQSNRYSRLVAGLKILLPLVGLGILATIFLFPRQIEPTNALPYADIDVDELTRDPQVGAPRFASVTEDGTAMTVAARIVRASPAGPGEWMSAEMIELIMESGAGQVSTIVADNAYLDRAGGVLELEGAVHMRSAAGYRLWTERLSAATDRTWLEGHAPVRAEGPPGQITAGGMILKHTDILTADDNSDTEDGPTGGGHLLVFTDGVKLLYLPDRQE
ncbi:LPS export ABC transporter periplasmic protein LptC [Alkalilacustris brevis]|uniref:LPS export ABC transporter periplasmic protein LptC n=1 Tax=Alkalilacustris brevis TaxID=2026338 RepID=UPI000E0D11E9|nr:LPS export ABC transporter periplasmic protein LptC [Alkalilacustris brevis]